MNGLMYECTKCGIDKRACLVDNMCAEGRERVQQDNRRRTMGHTKLLRDKSKSVTKL